MNKEGKEGEHVYDFSGKLGRSRYFQLSLTLANTSSLSSEVEKKRSKKSG